MVWEFLRRFKKVERFEDQRVHRLTPAAAQALRPDPASPETAQALCPRCGRVMEEALLVSRLPDEGEEVPIVVDGWVCLRCDTTASPRPLTVERSTAWGARGVAHVQKREFAAAEWWFSRIAWSWPEYPAAQLDLATALLAWRNAGGHSPERSAQLFARSLQYTRHALGLWERNPAGTPTDVAAHLIATLVGNLIDAREWKEARLTLAKAHGLEMTPQHAQRLDELKAHLDGEPEVHEAAAAIVYPHITLIDRPPTPFGTDQRRAEVAAAVEQLEAHYERHHRWPALWMAAKGRAALGDDERALSQWRRAEQAHGDVDAVVREASLALLWAGLNEEARAVNQRSVKRAPRDAALWSNLAITDLLCGDFAQARASVTRALELDPADPITRGLEIAIERWAQRGRHPATFAELNRSGD